MAGLEFYRRSVFNVAHVVGRPCFCGLDSRPVTRISSVRIVQNSNDGQDSVRGGGAVAVCGASRVDDAGSLDPIFSLPKGQFVTFGLFWCAQTMFRVGVWIGGSIQAGRRRAKCNRQGAPNQNRA